MGFYAYALLVIEFSSFSILAILNILIYKALGIL